MKRYRPIVFVALVQLVPAFLNVGCGPSAKPANYGAELQLCTVTAKTCEESIDCENRVRAKYNRPMRPQDGCQ